MNIDRFTHFFNRSTLVISLVTSSLLLAACGGSDSNKPSSSSASSISSQRSSFSATSLPATGSGTWPSVKVSATAAKTLKFEWSAVAGASYYKLMKNTSGNSGYVQVGGNLDTNSALDMVGVHIHDWLNTRYMVQACSDSGCVDSEETYSATAMINAIGYLKASNVEANDFFGWSLSLAADGMTLAVGAPAEDSKALGANGDQANNESTNSGAVYIFVKENNSWVQEAYLKASNTEQPNLNTNRFLINDRFGYRVALSDDGNSLAVSALLEDSPSYGIDCNQNNFEITGVDGQIRAQDYNVGAVYIFKRATKDWTQEAYLKPHFLSASELRFGESLAISGDGMTIAVGTTSNGLAYNQIINYDSSSSATACFEFYPSSSSSNSSSSSLSSSSISSSSSTAAITSSSAIGGDGSGAAYIFHYTEESGWQNQAFIKASNAQAGDSFGASLALSTDGNKLAVGALGEDSNAQGVNGDQNVNACWYYDGESIKIDATCTTAAKYAYSGNAGYLNNGAAYVFSRTDGSWAQEAYLKPASTYLNSYFGTSIDISGDGQTIAVGATGDSSNAPGINGNSSDVSAPASGAVYIFRLNDSSWAQDAYIKAAVVIDSNQFGQSVSLARDGNTLAVGTYFDASAAIGINGDENDNSALRSGAVSVFHYDMGTWSKKSYVKASNTDTDDRFGFNTDLSADGSTMAVSAHREAGKGGTPAEQTDNSADAAGAVYLY